MSETRVGHCIKDETDKYVGRGDGGEDMHTARKSEHGWLGNPYTVEEYGREECIEKFREDFEEKLSNDYTFRRCVRRLHGKTLGCWCQRLEDDSPACHAEVIAEWADKLQAIDTQNLIVCQEDTDSTERIGGYAENIHLEKNGCSNSPDGERLVFEIHDGQGSADLCPDCDWPEWVYELRGGL